MKSQLETISANLQECFDGKPWYGISVMEKLDAISWESVNQKTYGDKTIAILLKHIINWRIFILKKLKGDMTYDLIIDSEEDWTYIHIANQGEWEALKTQLQDTQDELLEILNSASEDLLNKKVPGKKYTFGPVLNSIAQHDIYHLGQIAMLNST